jgi:hypothetical protein
MPSLPSETGMGGVSWWLRRGREPDGRYLVTDKPHYSQKNKRETGCLTRRRRV